MTKDQKHVYEAAKELGYSDASSLWWSANGSIPELKEDAERATASHAAWSIR